MGQGAVVSEFASKHDEKVDDVFTEETVVTTFGMFHRFLYVLRNLKEIF